MSYRSEGVTFYSYGHLNFLNMDQRPQERKIIWWEDIVKRDESKSG